VRLLLEAGVLPVFVFSSFVPQATLLYWASNSAFFLGLQHALGQSRIARAAGLPAVMLPQPRGKREAEGAARAGHAHCCMHAAAAAAAATAASVAVLLCTPEHTVPPLPCRAC
jgi:hypothetical protein